MATLTFTSRAAHRCSSRLSRRFVSGGKATHTPTAEVVTASTSQEKDSLPFLQRPLGVKEPPSSRSKTKEELKAEFYDDEKRAERKSALLKELSKGYYHELNATRKHGGKTWIAPQTMIRADRSLYFPDIAGKSLATGQQTHTTDLCKGRISVLAVLGTMASSGHAQSFVTRTNAAFMSHPLYSFIQINLQENMLRSLLVKMFYSSIKKQTPPHLHSGYLISNQDITYDREALGITNKHVGYVYLLDENIKIRWAGCADATDKESLALESATGVLLNRLDKLKST